MPVLSSTEWERFLAQYPNHHFLQSPAWGALKNDFGWQPSAVVSGKIGAQVLFRRLPLGFSAAYLPKGPVAAPEALAGQPGWEPLWAEIDQLCQARRAIFLKVEPDLWQEITPLVEAGAQQPLLTRPTANQPPPGFENSPFTIQPPRTLVINLEGTEEEILGRMKQKTR